jgi:hypothetical protein
MARLHAAASAAALALLLASPSFAQTYRDAAGSIVPGVVPIGGDGSGPLFTSANPGKISGSFSATLSGFQPTPAYSAQSVTTTSTAYALPAGAVVIAYNTGANAVTIKLGASGVSVVAGQADVVPAGGWMAFSVGTATAYAVIGNGGPSSVVISGGSGLPTGAGGGGGSSAVPTGAAGSPSASVLTVQGVASMTPLYANETQWGGAALGAATAMGTAPSGNVLGTNADLFVGGAAASSSNPLPVAFGAADACMAQPHAFTPISVTSAASTQIVANAGSKKIYVCHILLVAGTADNVAIVEGAGTACATSTVGVIGGSTAATGVNAGANGGFVAGSGQMAVAATATAGDNLCLITSGTGPLSGVIVTAQQ